MCPCAVRPCSHSVALPCSYSHCLPPVRRALLQPASRALLPCPARSALPCSPRPATLQPAPSYPAARASRCPTLSPVRRPALQLASRTALPCSPVRCALLPCPARRALLPRTSRPAASRTSRPAALRVAPCCSPRVALYCSPRVALCCPLRHAMQPCCPLHRAPCPADRGPPYLAQPRRPARPSRATLPRSPAPPSRPFATTAAAAAAAAAAARATAAAGGGAAGSAGSAAGAGGAGGATRSAGGAAGAGAARGGQRRSLPLPDDPTPQQLREWVLQRARPGGGGFGFLRTTQRRQQIQQETFSPHVLSELVPKRCVTGSVEAAALGASESAAALGASESTAALGASESAAALGASEFAAAPNASKSAAALGAHASLATVSLANPTGGPVVVQASTVLPCPAVPSGSLTGLHHPTFSTNLVSNAAIQDVWFDTFIPRGQRVAICTCSRAGRHLATFTRRPGSSLYTLTTAYAQVAETLLRHHRLGHPSLTRLRGMHSCVFVSGLPRSLPSLPRSPAPPCLPFVEGRQRAAPHSSEFPPTTNPLQTLHMDVWGPALVSGMDQERYFLLVVDDYTHHTTVFPLRLLRLHFDRGGDFSSDLLAEFCREEGIHQSLTLPASPQQNRIAERRIGMIMEVAQTSPTLRWMGKVGNESVFRVWVALSLVRDAKASKLSTRTLRCVFLGFPTDALPWKFYYPRERRVFLSLDVTFDESGPTPSGVSQVDPPPLVEPLEISSDSSGPAEGADPAADDMEVTRRSPRLETPPGFPPRPSSPPPQPAAVDSRVETTGAEPRGAKIEGAGSGGAASGGAATGGAGSGGAATGGVGSWGALTGGADSGGTAGAGGTRGTAGGVGGAARAGGTSGAAGAGGARGATSAGGTGAGGTGGAGAAGPGGARTGGAGAARAGGTGGVEAAGARGAGALVLEELELLVLPRADCFSTRGRSRPCRCLIRSFARFLSPPQLLPGSLLPAPAPHTEVTESLTERREPETRASTPVRARRVARPCPPAVPGTHGMALRPSSIPQHVVLPEPPASSLPHVPDPESGHARAASPSVTRLLATVVTDPDLESTAAFSLVTELVDFAARSRLNYVASLVTVCPPSVGGEPDLSNDVLEDRQFELECLATALPRFASMLLCPEGDPDALDIPTPRSYSEAIAGEYSSQWQTAMDAEIASWKSTRTYVDEVPPPGANIVNGMWIFRVKRPPGSPPAFKARYVARGFSQRQGVDFFQTFSPTVKMTHLRVLLHVAAHREYELHSLDFSTAFKQGSLHEEIWLRRPPGFIGSFPAGTQWSLRRPVYGLCQAPREWHDTLRTTLGALGFAPSSANPSLFLRTNTTLPPFYVLVYVDDLVFATADTEALALVKAELQERHMCTDLGELRWYLGLQITRDKAQHTITLTQSHMVHQVLLHFGFHFSSPQPTPLSTGYSLSAPPSDESVEPSGPYPELVGCLMYLMTCTRPDLAYPLSLQARYVAPDRHRKVHWDVAKRVLRYLCSTSGMGLLLEGQGLVAGAMAAQELRWLTYVLTEVGERPRSPPVLYIDNKAMLALCHEQRLEHRTKHIALRYFLARELQQRR
ncbi:unnamed protein product [Closterium sp. NIES-53]